jgi:general stress protein 26
MTDPRERTSRTELPFAEKREEVAAFLAAPENAIMTLATSAENRVLARMVLIVSDDLDIYSFTWRGSRKCGQIRSNPRVALCKDRVQIEGTAEILGGLFDPSNASIRTLFEERYPQSVDNWRERPGMVLIKIRPTSVVLAGGPDEEPKLEFINIEQEQAYAEPWADR